METRQTAASTATTRRREQHRGERGFALLVSLIAIVGLTALATGGFFLANSERQTSSNHHAAVEAYHLANAGLSEFLGSWGGGDPGDGWSDTYQYPDAGGEATVTVNKVGANKDGAPIYRVRSVGRFTEGATPVTREVASLTVLNNSLIPTPPSSISSGGGITKNGSSGKISGADQCSDDTVAGVRVPHDPGYTQDGGGDVLVGNPEADSVDNPFGFLDNPKEWWQGMLDGTSVGHDHTIDDSSDSWPSIGDSEMPVTFVDNGAPGQKYGGTDWTVELGDNEDGRGLLIVEGNATFKGNFDWEGIILVGGSITDHGQGQIEGAVMTGVNTTLGENVSQDDLEDVDEFDGQKKYLFNTCFIQDVQNATAALAQIPSTWHEEF